MMPKTPLQVTHKVPGRGVVAALDELWHREGALTAADLRKLTVVAQAVQDAYNALDNLTMICVEEVEDLENRGAQDPSKATRVVQARQALGRFEDLSMERGDPEQIDVATLGEVAEQEGPRP